MHATSEEYKLDPQLSQPRSPALKGLAQASGLYLAANICSRLVGFLAIPVYSRFLSPTQYGVIELIELSTQVIAVTVGLGAIGQSLARFYHEQTNERDARAVISTGILATALFTAIVAGTAFLAAPTVSSRVFHSLDSVGIFRFAFAALFFSNMVEVLLVYVRIRERARFYFIYSLLSLGANLALNVYFIAFLSAGVLGFVLSKLIVMSIGFLFLFERTMREVGWRWCNRLIPRFVTFGGPLVLSGGAMFAIHFSDRFFLSSFGISLADIGRYSLAYKFAMLVSVFVGDSFGKSWSVSIYRLAKSTGWRTQFSRVATYLAFADLLVALALATYSNELIRLMVPPSYYPPRLLLPVLAFSYALRDIGDCFRNTLLIEKSTKAASVAIASAIANLILNFFLIRIYGVWGAAWATCLTWVIYLGLSFKASLSQHHAPVRIWSIVGMLALAVGSCAFAETTASWQAVPRFATESLAIGVFAVACFFLCFPAVERVAMVAYVLSRFVQALCCLHKVPHQKSHGTRQVLMLAYYFPPENVIGAARPGRFEKYLREQGHEVSVIAGNPTVLRDSPARNGVVRTPSIGRVSEPSRWSNAVAGIIQRRILPYNDRLTWVPHAVAAASAWLNDHDCRVIFSTSPPLATHIAALLLKWRSGLPWIADFRDPLLGNVSRVSSRSKAIDAVVEQLIFENADAIIANTEPAAEMWRKTHSEHSEKICVIWNGVDPCDRIAALPLMVRKKRVIAHVGGLYQGRSTRQLESSIHRLVGRGVLRCDEIELRLIGPMDNFARQSLTSPNGTMPSGWRHVDSRTIAHAEACHEMAISDYLLLMDFSGDNSRLHVPAKVFEYVQVLRPIIAFTEPNSSTQSVLAKSGIRHVCISSIASESEIDKELASFLQAPLTPETPNPSFMREFDARKQTQELARIIGSLGEAPKDATTEEASAHLENVLHRAG